MKYFQILYFAWDISKYFSSEDQKIQIGQVLGYVRHA